jgi:glutathione S-transferase/RNA polymerase-associated protein
MSNDRIPPIVVWEHPLSPYAQKVKIALREKGLAFEARTPDAIGSGAAGGDFLAANPRAEVPALAIGGRTLFDSTIMLEFIEDRFPHPALLPEDAFARAKARIIEEVCDTHYEAVTWGLSEIAYFRRAVGAQADAMRARAEADLMRLNGWLDAQLEGADWFGGARFGWADLCAAPFVQGAAGFGFGPAEGSGLGRWLARVRERESVAQAFQEARDAITAMSAVAGVVEKGLFKRQYRDHRLEWMIRSGGLDIVAAGMERDNIRFTALPG